MTTAGAPVESGYVGLAHPDGPIIVDDEGRVRWYLGSRIPRVVEHLDHAGRDQFVWADRQLAPGSFPPTFGE